MRVVVPAILAAAVALAAIAGRGLAQSRPILVAAGPLLPRDQRLVLAGGCFWGMEAVFSDLRGVVRVMPGYAGGSAATATYEQVSTGTTGHAESVDITFDPTEISVPALLDVFFTVAHDPTEIDRQGYDVGSQYRSVVFYANAEQEADARHEIAALTAAHRFAVPIATQVLALHGFYPAEAYHHEYAARHPDDPYIVFTDIPKLRDLRKAFPQLARD